MPANSVTGAVRLLLECGHYRLIAAPQAVKDYAQLGENIMCQVCTGAKVQKRQVVDRVEL